MKKTLVIGNGFLGSHIITGFQNKGFETIGTYFNSDDHKNLKIDVRNLESLDELISKIKPDTIVNCAANVQLDYLEKNSDIAFSINAQGAKNVAIIASKEKIRLIHISTDSVFDGKIGMYQENDIPNPINVYGRSKLLGEQLVEENSDDYVIVRTNFYGFNENGNFLFNWMLNNLREKIPFIGFSDIIFNPLEITNLSDMIVEISNNKYNGILHLSSDKPISKYDFALKIATTFGLDQEYVKKGLVDDIDGLIAKRPKNTTLSNKKMKQLLNTKITSVDEGLQNIKNM
jgi:dTDP-4-dehydrorhamnose reductase